MKSIVILTSVLALTAMACCIPSSVVAEDPPNKVGEDQAIAQIDAMIDKAAVNKESRLWRTTLPMPEQAEFDPKHTYFIRMETTQGPIRIKMMPEIAPMHVTSFIYLTRLGFYDDLTFHRVITMFMAQGGCPLGSGTGSPGYRFAGEFSPKERHNRPGLLSMANAGPGTDGSQFFLTFVPTPHLDDRHTIFGEIVEGMETLTAMEELGSRSGKTSKTIKMTKVTVEVE